MTHEQILLQLQQDYAKRRDDNLRIFEERQAQACALCTGLDALISARHAAVMQGVRTAILSQRKENQSGIAQQMAELNHRIAEKLAEGNLSADFLQPVYTCPICRDEGYVYDPSRRMCDCFRLEYNRRLLAESGVGENAPTFDDFDETLFSEESDEQGVSQRKMICAVRDICKAYADSFPDTQTPNLLLMGKSGLGKTFMLQCIARRVAQRGHLPVYASAYRLFETARKAYVESNPDLMNGFMRAELLLIDDLGTEPLVNNVTVTQLFNLLNERQMAGLHTVITTNFNMSELQERYTERITSRFLDAISCRRLMLVGADIRRNFRRKAAEK